MVGGRRGSHDKDNEENGSQKKRRKNSEVGDWSCERVVMATSDHDEVENDQK